MSIWLTCGLLGFAEPNPETVTEADVCFSVVGSGTKFVGLSVTQRTKTGTSQHSLMMMCVG
jgi:hypothetical protein